MQDIMARLISDNKINRKDLDFEELINFLSNTDKTILYQSLYHGLHHSEKVTLFAYILGKKHNLNEIDFKILLDAAFYHDIGRENENEDSFHGLISAQKIDCIMDSEIYSEKENQIYLKAICDMHSQKSDRMKDTFETYTYDNPEVNLDYGRFELLAQILMDADALDRTRFRSTSAASLEEGFLRLPGSKELIGYARLVNEQYRSYIVEDQYHNFKGIYDKPDKILEYCFHGIGFDFFKLDGILKHGILSKYAAAKKKVSRSINFLDGNNNELWISVINSSDVNILGKGYQSFIENGISFYCCVPRLCRGMADNLEAYEFGEPKISDEYEDESFVFETIEVNQIEAIIIPKEFKHNSMLNVDYLYGSCNYDVISAKINNYLYNLSSICGYTAERTEIDNILATFQLAVLNFEKKENQRGKLSEFIELIEKIKEELNEVLKVHINNAFHKYLGVPTEVVITIADIVIHFLEKNGVKTSNIVDEEEMDIFLDFNEETKVL